jgi:hypothetical protein
LQDSKKDKKSILKRFKSIFKWQKKII